MLCKTAEHPFDSEDWAFEIKWDGYRAIADLRSNPLQLYSRNGLDFSKKFLKITQALQQQQHQMVLDGEIVAYDELGKPNFQRLQQIGDNPEIALIYQVFDILWLNGHSTEQLTYLQRKELLKEALTETEVLQYHDYILKNGTEFFALTEKMGLEGIVAKKTDSLYTENLRSSEWLKIKATHSDEAIICGYTEPRGSRKKLGSLILGKYMDGEMIFCGHTGTGFNEQTLTEIYNRLQPLVTNQPAFKKLPKTNTKATWVQPKIVAEIRFTELTKDHLYRHPVFLRIREDIQPDEVHFESETPQENKIMKKESKNKQELNDKKTVTLANKQVKLTHQDKIYFPKNKVTKGDVIDYYQAVSKYILPHLKNRPESLNRFPNGIDGLSFFQKDAPEETPDWVEIQKVYSESTEKYINYIICNDTATLAYLNNLGCIELNVWTSRIETADYPDYLVLDLDPSAKNSFDEVIETAQTIHQILELIKIEGFPKTSGKTGIHVYIPMGAQYTYEQVKDFGHLLMQHVQQELPQITTLERNLQKRDNNKIYLDYLQNRRAQTLASVYSLRPTAGAPVSMPLQWSELKKGLRPTDFNIENAVSRLKEKGDLFKPVLGKGIDMLKAIGELEKNEKK